MPPISASWRFYVDWDDDGAYNHAIEDISAYVLAGEGQFWEFRRGRNYASQLTGVSTAGGLTLPLLNPDGRFSRYNSASPIYGSMLPGRRVKLTATYGGLTYVRFLGRLERIDTQPELGGFHTATLYAVGVLQWVNENEVSVAPQTNILTGDAITAVLDAISFPAADRLIDTGQTTMTRWRTSGKVSALYAIREIAATESGEIWETSDGKLRYEDRHHRLLGDHQTSRANFSDADGSTIGYRRISHDDPLKNIYNVFKAEVRIYEVQAEAVLWTLQETPSILPGASITRWASYPNPQSPAGADSVNAWTTPASNTDFEANSAADGTGTDLTADIAITATKFSNAMKLVLTNNGAVTAYIRGAASAYMQARGTPVYELDPIPVLVEDAASQASYGVRTFPHPGQFIPSVDEAENWAGFNRSIYKDPLAAVVVYFCANRNAGLMTLALTLEPSDRITIVSNARTKLGLNGDYFIEAIKHRIGEQGLSHWVTLECSPADAYGGFWILGTSLLGQGTKLGY